MNNSPSLTRQIILFTVLVTLVGVMICLFGQCCTRIRNGAVTVHAAPETTRELIVVEHRWFGSDTSYRVEIRHIDGRPEWAFKGKDGQWHKAFNFAEPEYYSELD